MVLFHWRVRFRLNRWHWQVLGVWGILTMILTALVWIYAPTIVIFRQTRLLVAEPTANRLAQWESRVQRYLPHTDNEESIAERYIAWRSTEPWRLLPSVTITVTGYQHTEAPFATRTESDPSFVEGKTYTPQAGQYGTNRLTAATVSVQEGNVYMIPLPAIVIEPSREELVMQGSRSAAEISSTLQKEVEQAHRRAKVVSITWDIEQGEVVDKLVAGTVVIERTDCKKQYSSPLVYTLASRRFSVLELATIAKARCTDGSIGVLTCPNCWLAPVSKMHSLPKTYAPRVVPTHLPGGRSLTPDTVSALKRLVQAAKGNGISLYITSAYRSYRDQETVFNAYIQNEKAKGASQKEAEERANRYSARPGQSEHQLGTTVDLRCSSCAKFGMDGDSRTMYNYLMENAHKYGFVMSYPAGREKLTGYQYEPWHWRYIGVTRATELFQKGYLQRGSAWYLSRYLVEKGEY